MTRRTSAPAHSPHPQVPARLAVLSVLLAFASITMMMVPGATVEAQAADGGSAGVTPASVRFTDPPLLPGGSSHGVVSFQQRYEDPVEVRVRTVAVDRSVGDASGWIQLERSGTMTLATGTHHFPYRIAVPTTAPNGHYSAGIAFDVVPAKDESRSGSSATTETSVTANLIIDVNNENELKRLQADGEPQVLPTEEGAPLRLTQAVTNTGNVDIVPKVRIEIQDKLQQSVLKNATVTGKLLHPGETQQQVFVLEDHGLARGQYWATVKTLLAESVVRTSQPQAVDVLAPGELARVAKLRTILVEDDRTQVPAGTLVKLTAVVENIGDGALVAQFDGEVRRDGQLVEPLTSKQLEVASGTTGNLTMLYRVDEPGRYEFVGRVHYGAKVTEEKSVLLTATADARESPAGGYATVAGALAALLVVHGLLRTRTRDQDGRDV